MVGHPGDIRDFEGKGSIVYCRCFTTLNALNKTKLLPVPGARTALAQIYRLRTGVNSSSPDA